MWLLFAGSIACQRASGARIVLDVSVIAGLSATAPIAASVVVNARAGAQEAKEGVMGRFNDNPGMSVPDDQVSRLRTRDSLKSFDSRVQIVGIGIAVWKAGAHVDGVHKMGTVVA